jgi:hypothetical protein
MAEWHLHIQQVLDSLSCIIAGDSILQEQKLQCEPLCDHTLLQNIELVRKLRNMDTFFEHIYRGIVQRALRPFDCFLARFDALLCNVACAFPSADVLLGTLDLFVQFSGGSVERCDVEINAFQKCKSTQRKKRNAELRPQLCREQNQQCVSVGLRIMAAHHEPYGKPYGNVTMPRRFSLAKQPKVSEIGHGDNLTVPCTLFVAEVRRAPHQS